MRLIFDEQQHMCEMSPNTENIRGQGGDTQITTTLRSWNHELYLLTKACPEKCHQRDASPHILNCIGGDGKAGYFKKSRGNGHLIFIIFLGRQKKTPNPAWI